MILVFAIVIALAIGLFRGGNLRNLGLIRVRLAWLALAALTVQLAHFRLPLNWPGAARLLFPLTHLAILIVAGVNRDLGGMRLLAAGVALNFIVIAANGGFMPVAPDVLVRAGIAESVDAVPLYTRLAGGKSIVLPRHGTALWWLSDTIALRPIQTIVSIGDILMVPGAFLFVEEAMLHHQEG